METNNLCVTDIQHFCMHDGPGIRTVVFLKGCPLHCRWCHNPETQRMKPQILFSTLKCIGCKACVAVCPEGAQLARTERSFDREKCISCGSCTAVCPTKALTLSGKEMTVDAVMAEVNKDRAFYGAEGGLTVSGGEPTLHGEALISLLTRAKAEGLSTCIETCGVFSTTLADRLLPVTDTFLWDVKDTDENRLLQNTGAKADTVLGNLKAVDAGGGRTVLRCIVIPEVNMKPEHGARLAELFAGLRNCVCVELLPYHPYGGSKAEQLGIRDYAVYTKPEKARVLEFARLLRERGVPVKCYGSMLS